MTESTFPHRDADGRVVSLVQLLAAVAAGVLLGVAALLLVDGAFAVMRIGRFGELSGWLAVILPAWLFVEEYRAWRAVPARIVLALVAGVFAVTVGVSAAALAAEVLPPLGSGAVAALVSALGYGVLWFVGIRKLAEKGVVR